ncbi:class I SAM-dependent methyltransferase [Pelagibius sp. 7325]|uniref:class I SAM-dependent methyltransferase n=1 Tax=Pelagibius sp. 7325 TaxID=3131994 RepID=UPI0030ECD20B
MAEASRHDAWQAGASYEAYMGRWSRLLAPRFLAWLGAAPALDWLEVGCGTGALSTAILAEAAPRGLVAVDASEGFLAKARAELPDVRAEFRQGDAQDLPVESGGRDVAVAGLVLNFLPDRVKALQEMRRALRPGGLLGVYVWDYPGGGMQMMRAFWDAAAALDPAAEDLREARRFPFCTPDGLTALAAEAGLGPVEVAALGVPTVFRDFDDYWRPFTLGAGPAPGYCTSLSDAHRERLRRRLAETLPRRPDGSIALSARAWAVRARPA